MFSLTRLNKRGSALLFPLELLNELLSKPKQVAQNNAIVPSSFLRAKEARKRDHHQRRKVPVSLTNFEINDAALVQLIAFANWSNESSIVCTANPNIEMMVMQNTYYLHMLRSVTTNNVQKVLLTIVVANNYQKSDLPIQAQKLYEEVLYFLEIHAPDDWRFLINAIQLQLDAIAAKEAAKLGGLIQEKTSNIAEVKLVPFVRGINQKTVLVSLLSAEQNVKESEKSRFIKLSKFLNDLYATKINLNHGNLVIAEFLSKKLMDGFKFCIGKDNIFYHLSMFYREITNFCLVGSQGNTRDGIRVCKNFFVDYLGEEHKLVKLATAFDLIVRVIENKSADRCFTTQQAVAIIQVVNPESPLLIMGLILQVYVEVKSLKFEQAQKSYTILKQKLNGNEWRYCCASLIPILDNIMMANEMKEISLATAIEFYKDASELSEKGSNAFDLNLLIMWELSECYQKLDYFEAYELLLEIYDAKYVKNEENHQIMKLALQKRNFVSAICQETARKFWLAGNLQAAKQEFERIEKIAKNATFYAEYGFCLFENQKYQEAIPWLDMATKYAKTEVLTYSGGEKVILTSVYDEQDLEVAESIGVNVLGFAQEVLAKCDDAIRQLTRRNCKF